MTLSNLRPLLITTLLAALYATSPAVAFEEPQGFGKARFGMSPEDFQREYPQAQLVNPPSPAAEPKPVKLISYRLEKETVGPLADCRVDFRFFGAKPELYEIQFLCPDRGAVGRYLTTEFGPPQSVSSSTLTWTGKKVGISFAAKAGAFSYGDLARSRNLQALLIQQMGLNLGGGKPKPAVKSESSEGQP